jgi:hypothetical protein
MTDLEKLRCSIWYSVTFHTGRIIHFTMNTPEEPRLGKILQSWNITPRADPKFANRYTSA